MKKKQRPQRLKVAAGCVALVAAYFLLRAYGAHSANAKLQEELGAFGWKTATSQSSAESIRTIITAPKSGTYTIHCASYMKQADGSYVKAAGEDADMSFTNAFNMEDGPNELTLPKGETILSLTPVALADTVRCEVSGYRDAKASTSLKLPVFTFSRNPKG